MTGKAQLDPSQLAKAEIDNGGEAENKEFLMISKQYIELSFALYMLETHTAQHHHFCLKSQNSGIS